MFKDPIECYEAIAREATSLVAQRDWKEIRIECELDGNSTDMLFEVVDAKGNKDYSTQPSRLPEYFFELARLVSTPEKGLYKVCRFSLKHDGKYAADFDY
jgi:hypothetical protein